MEITTEQVKDLRNKTGISIMQCKKALEEAQGDEEKALIILQKKGKEVAGKKSDRSLGSGVVEAYIHSNKNVGAIVELACETDFVAKNEEFKSLAYDLAMHITASNPKYMSLDSIPEEDKKSAMEIFSEEAKDKPNDIKEKIIQGKVDSYFGEKSLMDQKFIKDPNVTIKNLIESAVQKFGEKTEIVRFSRYEVGVSDNS